MKRLGRVGALAIALAFFVLLFAAVGFTLLGAPVRMVAGEAVPTQPEGR